MGCIEGINQNNRDRVLANINLATISLLLFIWVLPGTIALRNMLLAISFLISIAIIYLNFGLLAVARNRLSPLVILGALFLWVAIHFIFFSLNQELELSEIKGLWIRTFLGYIAAIGLGLSLKQFPDLLKYFYVALFFIPIINVVAYLYASYLHGSLVQPNAFNRFLFAKIETAYFGGIAAAIAVGNLISLLLSKQNHRQYLKIIFWLLGLTLTLVSALVSSTKNGMVITIALAIFLVTVTFLGSFLKPGNLKAPAIGAILFVVVVSGVVWQKHEILATQGWSSIIEDVKVSIDIDTNKQWQRFEGSVPAPLNSKGVPAALNTYDRVAWASVGMRLISQYPFGYGSINSSFVGLQKYAKIPNENQGQTHSGWVDFGLAFGIPGLTLVFLTLICTIYFGLKNRSSFSLPWVIFCIALIPFGLIAEITWKQYFEATIFYLALAASMTAFFPGEVADEA